MSTAQTSTETTALPAGVWTRDPIHSSLEFSVKHMVVATFRSSLPDFDSTLTVDDRYAGKFHVMIPPGTPLTDGQWLVDQKLSGSTTTASPTAYTTTPIPADRSIILRNASATAAGAPGLIISSGPAPAGLAASSPSLRVSPQDAEEISDILSVGSRVVVRK